MEKSRKVNIESLSEENQQRIAAGLAIVGVIRDETTPQTTPIPPQPAISPRISQEVPISI
jgi:hypothetical protein